MIDLEKKHATAAKAVIDLCAKLDTAIETFVSSGTQLGLETGAAGVGSPLNRVKLLRDVQNAVLIGLPSAKLSGRTAAMTRAKFSAPLRLAGISVLERIPCPTTVRP
jgi:hypothetical protein